MQCLAGAILVLVLLQNSLGQTEEDPGCGEKPRALNNYMRRLNNAEDEYERTDKPEDPNDPKSRTRMFRYKTQSYYPAQSRGHGMKMIPSGSINISGGPSRSWSYVGPSISSSYFHYGMSGSMNSNSMWHSMKYKVNIPMGELIERFMKLFMEWPRVKVQLEMGSGSFRDVLRVVFKCMYPEWDTMKLNMIFRGTNDEAVLKNIFVAMFPNWPQREINDIFAPTNTIPLIIRKLLRYLVPDMSQQDTDLIFSNTSSVNLILQRICEVMFPGMKPGKGADIFSSGNSVTHIFDGLLHGFFPQIQALAPPMQMDTVYTILFPGMSYNITSSEPNLPFLLTQYKNSQSMSIEPSKQENILMLILLEWLKQNPHITYKLPEPGKDDFDNFKLTFFQNTPSNINVPQEFHDDKFLRELFDLWKRFVVGRSPNDKQIDLQSILLFLPQFIQDRITTPNTNVPAPTEPTIAPATFTMDVIPHTITLPFIDNLKSIFPPDMIKQLIELFHVPDKTKSGPLILNVISNWQKNNLKDRVPLSKLMELILRLIANNWPDADVERVVGRDLNLEQILINLCKLMFLEWPNVRLEGKINSPQFILEMLLKKALPNIPKHKIEAAINGSNDMERVLHRIMKMLYPHWPLYDPSSTHFDPEVLEKILSEIIKWPNMKSTITAKGTISIPLLVESFIHAIFPSWPQYVVSMMIVGRTPLPLIAQKIIQMIATSHEDRGVVLHYDEQSPTVQISEAIFRQIFPDWPNYLAVLNIPIRSERNLVLSQLLTLVHGAVGKHENSLKCLNDRDSSWAFALFIAQLKYMPQ